MPHNELLRRVDRLSVVMPQIIRYLQRVPAPPARTPAISLPQLRMLLLLDMEGDSSMGDLARRAGVTLPTATSSINALVKGRYVRRHRGAQDRRVVIVAITPKGRKVLEELHKQRRERVRAILSDLEPDDQRRLVQAFETILDLLRRIDPSHAAGPDSTPQP